MPIDSAQTSRKAHGTYVLGTALTPESAIVADSAGEYFLRGGPVFLSVDVTGATNSQEVEVHWLDASGRRLRHDQRVAARGAHYVAFSAPTIGWSAGMYKAVVVIDGRRVSELTFSVG